MQRIYLDHAATTWPKCQPALQAAWDFLQQCGATAGRGSYTSSQTADRWLARARTSLSKLVGGADGNSIAICNSGTHALNAALFGILKTGDHVITTAMEHNSVLRPLRALEKQRGIEVDIVSCDDRGIADLAEAASLVRPSTQLVVVGHASNVTGAVQDIAAWSKLAHSAGARLLVDVSQTLGYIPIDVTQIEIDLLASAGHKGLGALPGTGFLYASSSVRGDMTPILFGGTGRNSEQLDGTIWPHTVETGNLNMAGVVSLAVAADELNASPNWSTNWRPVIDQLLEGLQKLPGLRLIGHDNDATSSSIVPLVSLIAEHWDVHDLASVLDTSFRVEARAGLHCAALVHQSIGTSSTGGTLRLSAGHATTHSEITVALQALQEILG